MKTYVLYHGSCPDGFGAAWSFWRKFKNKAEYIAVYHGEEPPSMDNNSTVFIIDFSYKRETLLQLKETHDQVTIIDHHKTAKDDLNDLEDAHFNMEKSGAVLSWEYLHGNNVPTLLKYVQDRDLWHHSLKNTKEMHAYISNQPYNFEAWEKLAHDIDNDFERIVATGKDLLHHDELSVASICAQTRLISFEGHQNVPCVNTPVLNSEVGNQLLLNYPDAKFSITWYHGHDGQFKLSFRSRPEFDSSVIAKKFGGGGHPTACGCRVDFIPGTK